MDKTKNKTYLKLVDIEASIQMFYMLVNPDGGKKAIELLSSFRDQKPMPKEHNEPSADPNSNNEEQFELSDIKDKHQAQTPQNDYPDLMTDEDKELWDFMKSQPETIEENDSMRNIGKFILPKRSKEELSNSQTKIVETSKDIKKPKLGF